MDGHDMARTMMREAVDDVPVRPVDTVRIRRAARRQSLVTTTSVAAGVLAVAAGASVVGMLLSDERPAPPAAGVTCPAPALGAAPWEATTTVRPGPADSMFGSGLRRLVLCSYAAGAVDAGPSVTLLAADPLAVRLVTELDAMEAAESRPGPECPIALGATYNIVAEYVDGSTGVVALQADGCRSVFNGTRQSHFASPALLLALEGAMDKA